jgi:hypothetical protein
MAGNIGCHEAMAGRDRCLCKYGLEGRIIVRLISLASAIALTEWSERTFWRRIADGTVTREASTASSGRTMIVFDSITLHMCVPLEPEEVGFLEMADAGDAEAQNDLGLIFLSHGKPKGALYWLQLASKQDYADAMHWIGRCYIEGNGLQQDENLGIMWLSKAAAHGHVISQSQIRAMRDKFVAKPGV